MAIKTKYETIAFLIRNNTLAVYVNDTLSPAATTILSDASLSYSQVHNQQRAQTYSRINIRFANVSMEVRNFGSKLHVMIWADTNSTTTPLSPYTQGLCGGLYEATQDLSRQSGVDLYGESCMILLFICLFFFLLFVLLLSSYVNTSLIFKYRARSSSQQLVLPAYRPIVHTFLQPLILTQRLPRIISLHPVPLRSSPLCLRPLLPLLSTPSLFHVRGRCGGYWRHLPCRNGTGRTCCKLPNISQRSR